LVAVALLTGLVWAWLDSTHGVGLALERPLVGSIARLGVAIVALGGALGLFRAVRPAAIVVLAGAGLALLGGLGELLVEQAVGQGVGAAAYGPRRAGLLLESIARLLAPLAAGAVAGWVLRTRSWDA
jgi:hypothetical protein